MSSALTSLREVHKICHHNFNGIHNFPGERADEIITSDMKKLEEWVNTLSKSELYEVFKFVEECTRGGLRSDQEAWLQVARYKELAERDLQVQTFQLVRLDPG